MSTQIITISEDVMNTVIKPISFLERYREEYYLLITLLMLKALVIMTSLIKATCLFYTSSKGGYKFTAYDLRNFSHKGVPFKDFSSRERQSYTCS
jgi:hypothetical protein